MPVQKEDKESKSQAKISEAVDTIKINTEYTRTFNELESATKRRKSLDETPGNKLSDDDKKFIENFRKTAIDLFKKHEECRDKMLDGMGLKGQDKFEAQKQLREYDREQHLKEDEPAKISAIKDLGPGHKPTPPPAYGAGAVMQTGRC